MAESGYRGLYAGDARVGHVVGAERLRLREVLRRRYYAGAGMRRVGQWSVSDGLARLGAGLLTAPLAFVLRRHVTLGVAVGRIGPGPGSLPSRASVAGLERLQVPTGYPRIALLHGHDLSEVRRGTERLVADLSGWLAKLGRRSPSSPRTRAPRVEHREGAGVVLNRRPPAPDHCAGMSSPIGR